MKYIEILLGLLQIISIVFYGLFVDYGNHAQNSNSVSNTIDKYYPMYQDVHVMIFIGFGYLMTFLRKHQFSSLGYNFFIACLAIQYSILINGFFHSLFKNSWYKISLDIETLITGDFAAGSVLIAFGALLGKVNLSQLTIISLCQLIFYAINEALGVEIYKAVDMGGSMFVHTFGAYFGLGVSYMITNKETIKKNEDKNSSDYNSDMYAMIGTIFLWMYWPSFNGALATGDSQHRVVINTVLSLTNSCLAAFIFSKLLRKDKKFNMIDIQNATLAGGVAVGSSADLVIEAYGALIIGFIAGMVSVIGYVYIQPFLEKYDIYDTCGVHNLHGMPGIIGGLGGFISSSIAEDKYKCLFPARCENNRSAITQGLFQLATLGTTIAISILGGLLTGYFVKKIEIFNDYFDDKEYWTIEGQEENEHNKNNIELK